MDILKAVCVILLLSEPEVMGMVDVGQLKGKVASPIVFTHSRIHPEGVKIIAYYNGGLHMRCLGELKKLRPGSSLSVEVADDVRPLSRLDVENVLIGEYLKNKKNW